MTGNCVQRLPEHPYSVYSLDRIDITAENCFWDGDIWHHTKSCGAGTNPCKNIKPVVELFDKKRTSAV